MRIFAEVLIVFVSLSTVYAIERKEIVMYEQKLTYYINTPDFNEEELSLNNAVSKNIRAKKLKEAYDVLFKWINMYNDDNYQSVKMRYIYIRIAHIYLYSEMWEEALNAFIEVMKYENSVGNPLLHLRIGQIGVILKDKRIYEDNLSRALIMGGLKVFDNEDEKLKIIPIKLLKKPKNFTWEDYKGQDWESTK